MKNPYRTGRKWAARNWEAEPEHADATAYNMIKTHGKEYAEEWRRGVTQEWWGPSMYDANGKRLPVWRDV